MGRPDKTLAAVFADPTRANLPWRDIESLLEHLGAEVSEGSGSRVRFVLNGRVAVFHRPHPRTGRIPAKKPARRRSRPSATS